MTGPRSSPAVRALHSAAALPFLEGTAFNQSIATAATLVFVLGSFFLARRSLRGWLTSRPRRSRLVVGVAVAFMVVGAAGVAGAVGAVGTIGTAAVQSVNVVPSSLPLLKVDSFPHPRHTSLPCLRCHETGAGHGRLTFEAPLGCAACHHEAPKPDTCGSCHRAEEYGAAKQATLTVTVAGHAPSPRAVDFVHGKHVTPTCVECHTTPVTLTVPPAVAQCAECHTRHHDVGPTCSSCHRIAEPKAAHTTVEIAHQRCDVCHATKTVAQLTPTRAFCGTCHASQASDHYDDRECAVCHLLTEPAAYRAQLVAPRTP